MPPRKLLFYKFASSPYAFHECFLELKADCITLWFHLRFLVVFCYCFRFLLKTSWQQRFFCVLVFFCFVFTDITVNVQNVWMEKLREKRNLDSFNLINAGPTLKTMCTVKPLYKDQTCNPKSRGSCSRLSLFRGHLFN